LDVSEEDFAFVFRVEEVAKNIGAIFLADVCNLPPFNIVSHPRTLQPEYGSEC
jgi:hypothetical protein